MSDCWYKIAKEWGDGLTEEQFNKITREKWNSVESSFIRDIAYFESLGVLEVRFKNGSIYAFKDVPRGVFENFVKSKSKGAFFNKVIKKRFGRK